MEVLMLSGLFFGKEARSHDEAQIQTLKDDTDGVLIFVHANGHSHADA